MDSNRTERYKLLYFVLEPEGWEFSDLDRDPEEMNNLGVPAMWKSPQG